LQKKALADIKAVIFDLDGTLLDTLIDLADSMNVVLADLGLPSHPQDAYRYFVGDGMETLSRRVLPEEYRTLPMIQRCTEGMRARYQEHWADKSEPYPGIPELLDSLSRRGLSLNILSNKPDDLTRLMVNHFLPNWRWSHVRGAVPEMPKKPDPSGALAVAEQLGVARHQFLYLGDTNTDMRTAAAAGMYPVGVLWGFRTKMELEESGAKSVLRYPLDLLKLF
jgi:phosphoglycolate phosphatase